MVKYSELLESFDQEPYPLAFEEKYAGMDLIWYFEDGGHEYKVHFEKQANIGKKVFRVVLGQKTPGLKAYKKIITKFKDPFKVIATVIEATNKFLDVASGKAYGLAYGLPIDSFGTYKSLVTKIIQRKFVGKLDITDIDFQPEKAKEEGLAYTYITVKPHTVKGTFDGKWFDGVDLSSKVTAAPVQAPKVSTPTPAPVSKPGYGGHKQKVAAPVVKPVVAPTPVQQPQPKKDVEFEDLKGWYKELGVGATSSQEFQKMIKKEFGTEPADIGYINRTEKRYGMTFRMQYFYDKNTLRMVGYRDNPSGGGAFYLYSKAIAPKPPVWLKVGDKVKYSAYTAEVLSINTDRGTAKLKYSDGGSEYDVDYTKIVQLPKPVPAAKKKTYTSDELKSALLDFKSMMVSASRRATWDNAPEAYDGGWMVDCRYWGNWVLPEDVDADSDDAQDYDWEELDMPSMAKLKAIESIIQKKYPSMDIRAQVQGEKNYISLFAKNSK